MNRRQAVSKRTLNRPASSTKANGARGHCSQIISGCGHGVPWLPLLLRLLKGIHELLLLQPVSQCGIFRLIWSYSSPCIDQLWSWDKGCPAVPASCAAMCANEIPAGVTASCARRCHESPVASSCPAFCDETTTSAPCSHAMATLWKIITSWCAMVHILVAWWRWCDQSPSCLNFTGKQELNGVPEYSIDGARSWIAAQL